MLSFLRRGDIFRIEIHFHPTIFSPLFPPTFPLQSMGYAVFPAVVVQSFPLEVPQKEASMKDEKKATKEEEMKDESEGFPSRWMIGEDLLFCVTKVLFLVECDCNL